MYSPRHTATRRSRLLLKLRTAMLFSSAVARTVVGTVGKALRGTSTEDQLMAVAQLEDLCTQGVNELNDYIRDLVAFWVEESDLANRAAARAVRTNGLKTLVTAFDLLVIEFIGFGITSPPVHVSWRNAYAAIKAGDGNIDKVRDAVFRNLPDAPKDVDEMLVTLLNMHALRAMPGNNDVELKRLGGQFGGHLRRCLLNNLSNVARLEVLHELQELLG